MLSPLRLQDIRIEERTFAHFTFWLIWHEAPLPLLGIPRLGLSTVPGWYVWATVISLLVSLGPIPVWTALCYPLGRTATGRTHIRDAGRAYWDGYVRVLWASLPVLVGLNVWIGLSLLPQNPPLFAIVGIAVHCGVNPLLGLIAQFARPMPVMFDLPVIRSWLYGLTLRWPMVSVGNLAFLLSLGAWSLGVLGWMLLPCTVTSTLLLPRRGYARKQALQDPHTL